MLVYPSEYRDKTRAGGLQSAGNTAGFLDGGPFWFSYRTLVKLVGDDTIDGTGTAVGDGRWQVITEHAVLKCQLTHSGKVRCPDEKGITRDYERSGPTSGRNDWG